MHGLKKSEWLRTKVYICVSVVWINRGLDPADNFLAFFLALLCSDVVGEVLYIFFPEFLERSTFHSGCFSWNNPFLIRIDLLS